MILSVMSMKSRWAIAAAALATALLAGVPANAETKPSEPEKAPAAGQTQVAPTGAAQLPEATIEGFRSARFGMTEAEVRTAIGKDFPGAAKAIKESTNTAERTKILTIRVPDVLPDSGAADVFYIFGYKSKALIQVGVVWSKDTDPTLTPPNLAGIGESLRTYFLSIGFPANSTAINVPAPEGLLLFRGTDKQGREVRLLVSGTVDSEGSAPKTLVPSAVSLIYAAKTTNPDVFKVPAGKF